jgi:hypothetical protein
MPSLDERLRPPSQSPIPIQRVYSNRRYKPRHPPHIPQTQTSLSSLWAATPTATTTPYTAPSAPPKSLRTHHRIKSLDTAPQPLRRAQSHNHTFKPGRPASDPFPSLLQRGELARPNISQPGQQAQSRQKQKLRSGTQGLAHIHTLRPVDLDDGDANARSGVSLHQDEHQEYKARDNLALDHLQQDIYPEDQARGRDANAQGKGREEKVHEDRDQQRRQILRKWMTDGSYDNWMQVECMWAGMREGVYAKIGIQEIVGEGQ